MEFMNMCDNVSGRAAVMSPKRSSTVHTFRPFGITLSLCFVESLLPPKASFAPVKVPSSFSWLYSCAHTADVDTTRAISARMYLRVILQVV